MAEQEYQIRQHNRRKQSEFDSEQMTVDKSTVLKRRKKEIRKSKKKKHAPGCYAYTMTGNESMEIKLTDIKRNHLLTVQGYIHQFKIYISDDIVNEIIYFYATPMILKVGCKQHTSRCKPKVILCFLYCPIDDTWRILCDRILFEFKLADGQEPYWIHSIQHSNGTCIQNESDWNKFTYISNALFDADIHSGFSFPQYSSLIHTEFFDAYSDTDTESDYTSTSSSSDDESMTLHQKLKSFDKIATKGQLFVRYFGTKGKKQDRIVRVSFDNKYKAQKIFWGSGHRFIQFDHILYISHGYWTPVLHCKNTNAAMDKLCFSVVSKEKILDLSGENEDMVELWVKGLRKLIGQTNAKADELSKQGLQISMIK